MGRRHQRIELGQRPCASRLEGLVGSQARDFVEADLKGVPFEKKLVSRTHEGIELQPLYTEETAPTAGDR